ncbi:hypothetical protein EMIT0P201_10174 [Pseudomonas chlororaphis]
MSPFAGNRVSTVSSRLQEGPAGLFAACGSGYRDLRRAKKSRASLASVGAPGRRSIARDMSIQPRLHAHVPCCVFEIAGRPCGPFRSLRQRLQGFAPGKKIAGKPRSYRSMRLARDGRDAVGQKPTLAWTKKVRGAPT